MSLARLLRPVGLISLLSAGRHLLYLGRRGARQQPALPRDRVQRRGPARGMPSALARLLRRLPQPDALRPRRARPPAAGGTASSSPTPATQPPAIYLAATGRVAINQRAPRHRAGAGRWGRGTPPTPAAPTRSSSSTVSSLVARSPRRSSPPRPERGPERDDHRRAARRGGRRQTRGESPHNELIDHPPQVVDPGRVSGVRADWHSRSAPPTGVTGRSGSFAIGLGVIFAYYIPMYLGPSLAKGSLVAAVVRGLAAEHRHGAGSASLLFAWRDKAADRPLRIPVPAFLRSPAVARGDALLADRCSDPRPLRGHVVRSRPRACGGGDGRASSISPPSSTSPTRCSRAMRRGA